MNPILEQLEDMGAEVKETIKRLMGEEDDYIQYLKFFFRENQLAVLQVAAKEGNTKVIEQEAHTLKGVTLNLGLLPIADPCIEILSLYREGKLEEVPDLILELENEFETWRDFVSTKF